METYLVGGAVRDKLLKLPVLEKDWVVVGSTPEEMLAQGFEIIGNDFPVFLDPKNKEEYALARTERKTGKGYKGFHFHADPNISLEEDLLRRDLTINAIAEDKNGNLIDPYGGLKDIENKILKHVSPAFVEDPVRVLRVARFAARFKHLGFTVAEETKALIKEIAQSGELDYLVPERIWNELEKSLLTNNPETFVELLRETEALGKIFPEIDKLFGVPQTAKHHPEIDTGIHLLLTLQQATRLTNDPVVRFAVLTHDFGKAETPKEVLPRHIGHELKSKYIAEAFCERLRVPKNYANLAHHVAEFHLLAHTAFDLRAGTVLKLLKKMSAFRDPQTFRNFVIACEADARGRTGFEDRDYPQAAYFNFLLDAAISVNSKDVNPEHEGKDFGNALDQLRVKAITQAKKTFMSEQWKQ